MEELVKITDIPTFFAQSLYDGFHIEEVLGFSCANTLQSLSECTKEDREIIEQYKMEVQESIWEASSIEGNAVFGIACVCNEIVGGKFNN